MRVIESAGESLKIKDFPGYSGGVGGGNGRYSYICFEKVELDCGCISTDQVSLVLSKDSAVDIPAQADDEVGKCARSLLGAAGGGATF